MENQEAKDGEKDGKACCGCGSKKCCCGGKALAAIALLAIGGVGGYFCARHCAAKDAAAAVAAPAQAPAK